MNDILDKKFETILQDVDYLKANDTVFKNVFPPNFQVKRERGKADMAALLRIIIGQQISNKVANTLWGKLTGDIDPNDPQAILDAHEDQLKSYGLSRQKISYARGLAEAVEKEEIDIASWINKDDETVISEITSLKGFGPWSAQMFMMFHLCHRHIWPIGDLGLQMGLKIYLEAEERPTEKDMQHHRTIFEGRETAASFLLWALKGDALP
jgi:DNA-3-methyladenine glycosylase II